VRHAAREGSDTAGLKRELLRLVLIVLLIAGSARSGWDGAGSPVAPSGFVCLTGA
jgi:hypothetical protein